MKASRFNYLQKYLPGPGNRLFWFCFLLIIKFVFLLFLINQHRPTTIPDTIAVCSGDCDSYLTPIDNLVQNGSYEPDYRMPGYGFPYLLFRLFFQKNIAADLLIILQTFIDAFATLILAITLYMLTEKKSGFYLAIIFYGASATVSCYNNWVLTESMTASAFIFGFYFLVKYFKTKNSYHVFLSGLFFTWTYFLRPVNLPVLLIPLIIIFFFNSNLRLRNSILFLLPALVFQSLWTFWNYEKKDKLFILNENQYLYIYRPSTIAAWNLCKTFSDFKITASYFQPEGLTYFGQPVQIIKLEDIKIDDEIYTEDFNRDSLLAIRKYFAETNSQNVSPERRNYLDNVIISKCNFYAASIRKHHPFLVYIKTPLMLLKNFIFQSGVHNLFFKPFSYLPSYQKIIKLIFIGLYWIVFILFILAMVLFPKKIIDNKLNLAPYVIVFYIIFIHSVFLRSIEPRYIIPAYPFFVIGAVYSLIMLKNYLKIKNTVNG